MAAETRISGNLVMHRNLLPKAGDNCALHKHHYDHTLFLVAGSVHVRCLSPDGSAKERDLIAPDTLLIPAEDMHEIVALGAGTEFWCVFPCRDYLGDVSLVHTGWERAYT